MRILHWKEQKIVSVAGKYVNRYISLESRLVFSINFSKKMFEVDLLTMFEIRIKYISFEDNLAVDKILAPLILIQPFSPNITN